MEKLFKEYGFNLTEKQYIQFENYYNFLIESNEKFNITAITDKKDVYIKHFIDSILGLKFIKGKTHIDIGSGGGFPAIPLKILNKDLELTLLEATEKKCNFLQDLIEKLQIKNVRVVNGRAEEFAFNNNFREKFDICSARAVARLNILSEYCLPFVKKGGEFISYKGDAEEELKEAENAIKILGGKVVDNFTYQLDGAKRSLIIIEKVENTKNVYPRSNGKIRKKPL